MDAGATRTAGGVTGRAESLLNVVIARLIPSLVSFYVVARDMLVVLLLS